VSGSGRGRRILIVNADDYALTAGVSRAILHAHRAGIVTSTSVLALGPAYEQSVPALRDAGTIGTGAHLAAVGEDPPLLTAREIPTLVDRRGRLRLSWRQLLALVAARRVDLDDLRREFAAQLDRLRTSGLTLTHVDTHQHVHLWPPIAAMVLELAAAAGIPSVRVTRSAARGPIGITVRRLAARLEAAADAANIRHPQGAAGLDEAGGMTLARLITVIARLGASGCATAEIGVHPGEAGDPALARYRWGYRWADELAALTAPEAREAVTNAGFELGTFADLPAAAEAATS